MSLPRRELLRLAGLAGTGVALTGCAPRHFASFAGEPTLLPEWPLPGAAEAQRLQRLTFGPTLVERQRVAEIGLEGWIEEQLAPDAIEDAGCERRVRRLDSLGLHANELADWEREEVIGELRQATLLRQRYSRRQLYEIMVAFWSDHFNIYIEKGGGCFLLPVHNREVIRRHALGTFRDLLWATAHSPAMLVYLDNQSNHRAAPNENYARELLELHTLGVRGGYSQADVLAVARCLTGWGIKAHFWWGEFRFDAEAHDEGSKEVLGQVVRARGQAEAEEVIERLAAHPATAHFLASKLVRRFIADEPPPRLVERAARAFSASGGEIRALLNVVLLEGLDPQNGFVQPKFKRPQHFVVSALRLLHAETGGGARLHRFLARMGQPFFGCPTPDGYPDTTAPWLGNLMPRWEFALALARNRLAGLEVELPALLGALGAEGPAEMVERLGLALLGQSLPPAQRDALLATLDPAAESFPALLAASLLASPAFQWY